jgi:hypothetical protein
VLCFSLALHLHRTRLALSLFLAAGLQF